MTYQIKPLHCDPAKLKGLSEKLMDYGAKAARLHEECIK